MRQVEVVGKVIFTQGKLTFCGKNLLVEFHDGSKAAFDLADVTMYANADGKLVVLSEGNWFDWAIVTQVEAN